MFKKYWLYFCLIAALVILALLIIGAGNPPSNFQAFMNSMQNYFLNPQHTPQNTQAPEKAEKKQCRPKNKEDKSCELYTICDSKGNCDVHQKGEQDSPIP